MPNADMTSTRPIFGPGCDLQASQAQIIRPAQTSMFARVNCYPPLGQVTCPQRIQKALGSGQDDTIRFTVVLESSTAFPEQTWEVDIWHNIAGPEWTALSLEKQDGPIAPLMNSKESEYQSYRHVFSQEISLPNTGGHSQFTVRFRPGPDADWHWVNEQQHVGDGELVFAPSATIEMFEDSGEQLRKYFDHLSSEVNIESRKSEAPGSVLWKLSGEIDPAKDGTSSVRALPLGAPSSVARYFALARVWTPWLGPRHGRDKFKLTEDAILCSFLRTDGIHVVLLAVSGTSNVTVLESGEDGEVIVRSQSDSADSTEFQVLAAVADKFDVAMSAVMYEARKAVRPYEEAQPCQRVPTPISPPGDSFVMVEKDPEVQWLADWYDGLTYCTWNGLGQNLTEEKLLGALKSLKDNGIKISNLIIDDNWQALDSDARPQFKRRWTQFEANPDAFPRGLKHTIEKIRESHPNVDHIAVWHALFGYWGGIAPNSELTANYKTKEVKIKDPAASGPIAHAFEDKSLLAIDPDDIQRFYTEFYSFLSSAGVDSVKTDAQFFIDLLEDPKDRREFASAYQDAWSIASLRYFSTRAISCMSLFPQAIFHNQLPTNKPTIPLRNSDDFFPDIPESHPWHIFCNAHNALFTRFLNVLPDWDMFQTSHPYASFHAAARCVSGGPIYITDEPGNHNISLINEMTAPTVHGYTVILRPSLVGRTIDAFNGYNEGHILRVGTYTGWARTGSGILGLFNVSATSKSCLVSLLDFPGIHEDYTAKYIVRSHARGKITDPMTPTDANSIVAVNLEQKDWDILTAYPTRTFTLRANPERNIPHDIQTDVAVLGLLGKMTGAAALVSSDTYVETNGRLRVDISLKALGTLGIYFSNLGHRSIAQNFMVTILGDPVPQKTVQLERGEDARLLSVDIAAAWKEMRLEPGWSNEIIVHVFVG
ncbi:glycoside hydrolase [Aspergillus steynii IBT 23096]|uniref:Glycoside hydrolase n=1 Tax=Aspergillus steynii IBT 23096 TaxID=1392250 RepID=A0A2I2GNW7_9EURO|nr:glycoside hydrolase [Aspergillus steynii IBT 23096]PLB54563.1 glycoside hydrolase [Aspergillus steynii IBT 23096]